MGRVQRRSGKSLVRLGSSTSSDESSERFFAPRISWRRNAPSATKMTAATKAGGVSAARSDSTAPASYLLLALPAPGSANWPPDSRAADPVPGQSTQANRRRQIAADLCVTPQPGRTGQGTAQPGTCSTSPRGCQPTATATVARPLVCAYLPSARSRPNAADRPRMPGRPTQQATRRLQAKGSMGDLRSVGNGHALRIRHFIADSSAGHYRDRSRPAQGNGFPASPPSPFGAAPRGTQSASQQISISVAVVLPQFSERR